MIVGSGGVLSHAPLRGQSALMMMDAYQPEGVTLLTVDSIFMYRGQRAGRRRSHRWRVWRRAMPW